MAGSAPTDTPVPRAGGRLRPGTLGRLAHLAFLVVTLVLAMRWVRLSLDDYLPKEWSQSHIYDGLADYYAARFWVQGRNLYTKEALAEINFTAFGHPPTTGFWFIPLAPFDKPVAAEIMALSSWLLLIFHLYICARELKIPAPVAFTILGFAWILNTDMMTMQWHAIQLSEQIAFPLVLCWVYLRRGKDIPAGIALGAAATLKFFPGVTMLFLLFARRFRAFAAAAAAYLVVAIVMTAGYGVRSWPMFFSYQDEISAGWMGSIRNASLQGVIMRAFLPLCEGHAVPRKLTTFVSLAIGALLFAGTVLVSRRALRHAREHDPRAIDVPFALISVVAVFLNPWSWEHYYLLMVQPALVIAAATFVTFRGTFRAWLDEQVGRGALVRSSIVLAVIAAGMAVNVWMLEMSVYSKTTLEGLFQSHRTPWNHRMMHVMEVIGWLPWAITIVLGLVAAWYVRPRGPRDRRVVGAEGQDSAALL